MFSRRSSKRKADGESLFGEGLYLIANKRLVRGHSPETLAPGEFPSYAYWEPRDDRQDSGWRLFVGDESQDDADDPDNFQIDAVDTVLTVHPDLHQLLRAGVTGEWEWSEELHRYEQSPPD